MSGNISVGTVNGPFVSGGGVNNVAGGDLRVVGRSTVAGRDAAPAADLGERLAAELARLRAALDDLRLTRAEHCAADRALTAAETAARGSHPDADSVGSHLESFAAVVRKAGALASAGASLLDPVGALAKLLGSVGSRLLDSLQGV